MDNLVPQDNNLNLPAWVKTENIEEYHIRRKAYKDIFMEFLESDDSIKTLSDLRSKFLINGRRPMSKSTFENYLFNLDMEILTILDSRKQEVCKRMWDEWIKPTSHWQLQKMAMMHYADEETRKLLTAKTIGDSTPLVQQNFNITAEDIRKCQEALREPMRQITGEVIDVDK